MSPLAVKLVSFIEVIISSDSDWNITVYFVINPLRSVQLINSQSTLTFLEVAENVTFCGAPVGTNAHKIYQILIGQKYI